MQSRTDDHQQTYCYDPNEACTPLACIERHYSGDKIYWYHTDLNGSPQEVTNKQGEMVWSGQYGVFGQVTRQTDAMWRNFSQPLGGFRQPLRYAGQYLDEETGLHYNTFRYYAPEVGRFTTPDPIGLAGGINLYAYAPNPLSWIDPLGLKCTPQQLAQNRANGKAWEANVTQAAQNKYGANNVFEQVYIRPLDANGNPVNYRVIVDNAITSPNSPVKLVDAKASTTAPFTKNQTKGYPLLSQNGGIIDSGPLSGKTIGPTGVNRIDPTTIGNL
ncbi:RHS repeat-associated core domain-containing protein [Erwinia sorbitola]|uniref:RHS repeat-associated core domain-containing protein n=1 Tax=Erwinia sorbitola TaxID=2681984 RepID=UPI001E5A5656|nr:RHS repeat-associated core domain-containing protein [Erwinia sorbitola]